MPALSWNMAHSSTEHPLAPHLALIAVQLMFGSWPIFGKIALRVVSPTSLVAIRIVGATISFLVFKGNLAELRRLPRRDLLTLVLCSLLGVSLNQFLYVKGLSLTTVINATLLGTTIPVFTLLVSLALGYDKWSLRRFCGVLLAASGVIYLIDPLRAEFSTQTTMGNLLIVINCIAYGSYIAISKELFRKYGALKVITWVFLIASVFSVVPAFFTLDVKGVVAAGISLWLILAYIVLAPTVGAYYLNAWALTKVSPTTVAAYIYLQPLVAFLLAPRFLGESWTLRTLVASILIFAGVFVVTKRGRSRAAKEVTERPDALAH